jgi:hypothetical protein
MFGWLFDILAAWAYSGRDDRPVVDGWLWPLGLALVAVLLFLRF